MNTFYEELTASLDKLADIIDPDNSAEKPQTYNDSLVFSCQRIADHFKAGGSLPEVTAEDDGDVLTVVDGEWGKAAPSGAALPEVTAEDEGKVLTVDDQGEWVAGFGGGGDESVVVININEVAGVPTMDKTWAEINAATVAVAFNEFANQKYWVFVVITGYDIEHGYWVTLAQPFVQGTIIFNVMMFSTSTENGYPVYVNPSPDPDPGA